MAVGEGESGAKQRNESRTPEGADALGAGTWLRRGFFGQKDNCGGGDGLELRGGRVEDWPIIADRDDREVDLVILDVLRLGRESVLK